MELSNHKNHWYVFLEDIIKDIKASLPFIILILVKFRRKAIIFFIVASILDLLCSFIQWKKTSFSIKDGVFNYNTGVISKKELNIPINKISTVDFGQNIIQRIFNIYRVKIDSGSISADDTEVNIVLSEEIAFKIRDIISCGKDKKSDLKENILNSSKKVDNVVEGMFKVSNKELFLYAITKNNLFWGLGMLFAANEIVDKIGDILDIKVWNKIKDQINLNDIYNRTTMYTIYDILGLFIVFLIISIILSIMGTIIKFYNFKVYKKSTYIVINYGLFNKKQYSLPIDSIRAIKLKQNYIKQKFNLYKIEICTVGYGDESGEEAILYPLGNKKIVKDIIMTLLPEFEYNGDLKKAPKTAWINFTFIPTIITILLSLIVSYLNIKFSVVFIIVPIVIVSRYFNYKNMAIGFNDNIFIAISNGFLRTTTLVKVKSVQSISMSSNYFQRKKQLCTYIIAFRSNTMGDNVTLKHLKNTYFRELESKINF